MSRRDFKGALQQLAAATLDVQAKGAGKGMSRRDFKRALQQEELLAAATSDVQAFKKARHEELLGPGTMRFRVDKVSLCECDKKGKPFKEVACLFLSAPAPVEKTLLGRMCPFRSRR